MADCGSFQSPADASNRISVKGEAEEIAVSPMPRSRQRHGKRSNPYSTRGLDKFESVYAELSSKREYIANRTRVPEAMVRFVSSEKGWIPVVIGARDLRIRRENGDNGEMSPELRTKDEGNDINGESERRGLTVNAPTSPVRAHDDPTDFWDKMFRRFVSMDDWPSTRPASPVQGSDSFYMRTRPALAYNDSVGALTVMMIMLFCFAILFTGAWLYIVKKLKG